MEYWRIDGAGRKRRLTVLQDKIIRYRIEHPEWSLVRITKELGCSYAAVHKTIKNPMCQEREAEIRERVDKRVVASLQERQERLTEIIRAKITDYIDEGGNFTIGKDSPCPAAIAEYSVLETKRGPQRKIRLYSAIEAIEALDREEGIGRPAVDQRSINITHVTVVEHPQMIEGERDRGSVEVMNMEEPVASDDVEVEERVYR